MFPAGLEPATFRVLGGRDNHYTTETTVVGEGSKCISYTLARTELCKVLGRLICSLMALILDCASNFVHI